MGICVVGATRKFAGPYLNFLICRWGKWDLVRAVNVYGSKIMLIRLAAFADESTAPLARFCAQVGGQ